jgi:hypothetical protein
MRSLTKSLVLAFATLLVASCGGGGGGSSGSGFTQAELTVTVQTSGTTTPNSLVSVVVSATTNNQPLPNGTVVTLRVSPPGLGLVSAVPVNGGNANVGEVATGQLAGGAANFRFHSRAIGAATLTASVTDPAAPARVVTGSATINVAAGAPSDPRVVLSATALNLPVNGSLVGPFLGSPYLSEVTITQRTLDGSLVSDADSCTVAATPVTNGAFSTLDDPETTDINEFEVLLGSGPVDVNAGRGTIFVTAFDRPGPITITVACQDPQTGEAVQGIIVINVGAGVVLLPASILIVTDDRPVYIQGVNGNTALPIEIGVFDGSGAFVPDPGAGVNNVRLEIVGGAQGGERLQAVSASGANQTGSSVVVRSGNGVATAVYTSGSRTGSIILRATSDRADNNVDNGIQDPVTSTRQINVSDGRLFSLQIDTSNLSAINNLVTAPTVESQPYRVLVSVTALDRGENPVPPGTQITWGAIDFPLTVDNSDFAIRGGDGDPQEGGTLFTAPGGAFTTAGGGAGPGDTLVVFGNSSEQPTAPPGNRDLESARTVASVNSATSLNVTQRFNFNDDTGTSVNNGPVLPYVIGRATSANITANSQTNSAGVATAVLTYPRSSLGRPLIIWARGAGDFVNGSAELVTDVEEVTFPAAGPGTLTAAPSTIPANASSSVNVCLTDSTGGPVPNATINFAFSGSGASVSTVNGQAGSGTVVTGANGCSAVSVTTSGVVAALQLRFSVGELTATVTVDPPGALTLSAAPNPIYVGPGSGTAGTLLCVRAGGTNPVSGVSIAGTCTAPSGATLQATAVLPTDGNGCTNAAINYANMAVNPNGIPGDGDDITRTGTCTYTTAGGLTVTVTVNGVVVCPIGVSPPPPGC